MGISSIYGPLSIAMFDCPESYIHPCSWVSAYLCLRKGTKGQWEVTYLLTQISWIFYDLCLPLNMIFTVPHIYLLQSTHIWSYMFYIMRYSYDHLSISKYIIPDLFTGHLHTFTGWWYTYPSEDYEFVSWDDDIPNWMESHKIHVPNRQSDLIR
jgi:hypothetical protein